MQSESNHIDNFFRRKEAASVADNRMADTHWKQMQEMMNIHPVSKAPKNISSKIILKYAAIILLVAAGVFFVLQNRETKKSIAIKPSSETNKELLKVSVNPTLDPTSVNSIGFIPKQPIDTSSIVTKKQKNKKAIQKKERKNDKKDLIANKQETLPGNKSIAKAKEPEEKFDNASVFKKFNTDIKKEPEYFKINTTRDTTIVCKEGTTVFIPANAFLTMNGESVSGPITFAIKEFYNVADIISNNLTTVSNGKQLITGGMLNIGAFANDKPLQIKQGSFIDLKMPTRAFNAQMQLFTGQENSTGFNLTTPKQEKQTVTAKVNYETKTITVDTTARDYISSTSAMYFNEGINWIPGGQQQFFIDDKKKEVTLFDVQDNSRVVYRKNKSIAKYLIPYDCPLTIDEIKKILTERYSKWYDEIRVRRAWKPWSKKKRENDPVDWIDWKIDEYFVGDSVVMPLKIAMRRKLITREDSLRYEAEFKKKFDEAVRRNEVYNEFVLQKRSYDFRITGLGWINCDRFLNYPPGRLSEFYVKTPEGYEGAYFSSMLMFENDRSAMAGSWDFNGRINFPKIPLGEKISLVCLGAKDGKMYASVQELYVERDPNIILKFEEVTPEEFKQKLSRLGSVQN